MKKNQNIDVVLEITSKPKVKIFQTGMIKLQANPDLQALKYVKFRYNNLSSGKFETIELISNLSLDTIDIIELSAQRWRATETEFNILQHGYGLEKLFVRDPRKVWPLFLLALICKSIFEMILEAIHSSHGGKMDIGKFKMNLGIIIDFIASDRDNELPLSPCFAGHHRRW